jgi:predicted SprT family Zn-dependent metalloprotease
MRGSNQVLGAHASAVGKSRTGPVTEGRRSRRRPAGRALNRDDASLVASVRSATISGVISGQLARTLQRWAKLWRMPELLDRLTFRCNPRLRTTIARWVIRANCVEVSVQFFELHGDHREILCHELAHAAAVSLCGRVVQPHGTQWRELVRRAGYEPSSHRVTDRKARASWSGIRSKLVYEHRCPVCHSVRYGKAPVKSWRCVECADAGLPGDLTITRLDRVVGGQ